MARLADYFVVVGFDHDKESKYCKSSSSRTESSLLLVPFFVFY